MPKKKKSPNGKRSKPKKSASLKDDPEWDVLEERFSGISSDFGKLAEMADKQ